jgi:hypothetical protein
VAHSPDGSRIVSGGQDKTVKVRDAKSGQDLMTLKGHESRTYGVAYSPDGRRLASASEDNTVRVWDARTGENLLTLKGHTNFVYAVSFSPDGSRIVSASADNMVKMWDARAGLDLLTLRGHTGGVQAVAFSPDGTRIASGSVNETVKVWAAPSEQEVRYLAGHLSPVAAVAFSPDGKHVFGRDESGKTLAWEAETGRLLRPATAVAMPPDSGPTAASGNHRAEARGNLIRLERTFTAEERSRREQEEAQAEAVRRARRDRDFHAAEAQRFEKTNHFACVFHLDRLLALRPDDRPALLKRRAAVLDAARQKDATDPWPSRALARQAVAAFGSIGDPKSLLAAVARRQDAALDRLHGALLLRTGDARNAALVLRAALRHRADDEPPIDDLLLALALIVLERRDEARQRLTKAAAWMERGVAPLRAASLLGLRPCGPLAALGAVYAPDVRLNPLDPFTAHELNTLRREAEQTLSAEEVATDAGGLRRRGRADAEADQDSVTPPRRSGAAGWQCSKDEPVRRESEEQVSHPAETGQQLAARHPRRGCRRGDSFACKARACYSK